MKCQFKYKHLIASWEVPAKVELLTEYSEGRWWWGGLGNKSLAVRRRGHTDGEKTQSDSSSTDEQTDQMTPSHTQNPPTTHPSPPPTFLSHPSPPGKGSAGDER